MPRLLVIADDLTGASDTGVQFAKKGIPVLVLTGITCTSADFSSDHHVLVVNSESRHVDAGAARQRVARIVEMGLAAGIRNFYKKADSTLRGNIGSELEAFMIASGQTVLAFIPAFPKLGRTTREGVHYVDDKPLRDTEFAEDPVNPITDSFIPGIIGKQTTIQTRVLSATEFASTTPIRFDEEGIYVFDVTTDVDLRDVGEILKRNNLLKVSAGSSGFAECLPHLLGFAIGKSSHVSATGRMLVVNGSINQVSMMQVAHAEAHGFACMTLSPKILLAEDESESSQTQQFIARVIELDEKKQEVILRSAQISGDTESYLKLGRKRGLDQKQTQDRMISNLGRITAHVLNQTSFKMMTVFGGDTLQAIARARGWSGLLPQEEILPGVVVSRVREDPSAPLLITKAGGFGPEDVLLQIKGTLRSATI